MSVSTVKAITLILVAIAIGMVLAAASQAFDRTQSFAWFFGACGVLIVSVLWYRRAIPAAEAEQQKEDAAQVAMLKQHLSMTNQPVSVKSSSGVLMFIFMLVLLLAAGWVAFAAPSPKSVLMLVMLLLVTLFTGLFTLPVLGKPALAIVRDGLVTPDLGFFKWEEIESIGLSAYTHHGATSHVLCVYAPSVSERVRDLHPLLVVRRRLLRNAGPDVLAIPLRRGSHRGPVIHSLCYELWKERTGRTSMATSAPSQEFMDIKRRADEQLEALKDIECAAKRDPAEAMKLLDEMKRRFPTRETSASKRPPRVRQKVWIEAMLSEMSKIDPSDVAARQRVQDAHMKAEVRRGTSFALIAIIVGFAGVVTVFLLLN